MNAKPLIKRKIFALQLVLLLPTLLLGCGKGESDDDAVPEDLANKIITGSIKSITGTQSEMNQWVLAMIERDSGITRAAVVNAVGYYTIEGIDLAKTHTMVLLDPQFRFSAVLTYAGQEVNSVRQYFRTTQTLFPTIVHNGPIISFTDASSMKWQDNRASDSDGDQIPDGTETVGLRLAAKDIDNDAIDNSVDSDIDGDGVANWFDADDDNDGILDAFDPDANGNDTLDLNETVGDLYFPEEIKYIAVQVMQDVLDDQSLGTTLTFTAKIPDEDPPEGIRVRAPASLIDGSRALQFNVEKGELNEVAWDGVLVDDGLNEDGAAGDKTFARRIRLAAGKVPKAHQVLFIQTERGAGPDLRRKEFAYTFPPMVSGAISGTYAADTRLVTLSGAPFGGITEFRWSVHLYDASAFKVFSSEPIPGGIGSYKIPSGVMDAGKSYTARIVATALERIPSFPSWVIRSAPFNL